jgi:hypothetical protein
MLEPDSAGRQHTSSGRPFCERQCSSPFATPPVISAQNRASAIPSGALTVVS